MDTLLVRADTDGDGTVSWAEFVAAFDAAARTAAAAAATSAMTALFHGIDSDRSGAVSQAELQAKLAADREVQSLLEAAGGHGSFYVLEQLDADADGLITLAEFIAGLTSAE